MKNVSALTLFVEDVPRAKAFYENVFGRPLVFEDDVSAAFKFENTIVNLLAAPAAGELIEPGTVAPPDAGARVVLTVDVENVDATCAELAKHGVELLNGPIDREWGIRTASFRDPDCHIWEIAHPLS